MHYVLEPFRQVGSDTLGRRQRIRKLGMFRFETFEFLHQHIEIDVRNLRLIQHIIIMVVAVEFRA